MTHGTIGRQMIHQMIVHLMTCRKTAHPIRGERVLCLYLDVCCSLLPTGFLL